MNCLVDGCQLFFEVSFIENKGSNAECIDWDKARVLP